jgi:hypothetical protein
VLTLETEPDQFYRTGATELEPTLSRPELELEELELEQRLGFVVVVVVLLPFSTSYSTHVPSFTHMFLLLHTCSDSLGELVKTFLKNVLGGKM